MPFLPHSTTYDFDSLPLTLSADGWEECDGIAGRAKIDYDAIGYWRIVGIIDYDAIGYWRIVGIIDYDAIGYWRIVGIETRQWFMPRSKYTGARLGNYQERYSDLPKTHPLYHLILAMLTTDRYVERRNIDDHIAELIADMRASAADNRADRVVSLRREAV